VQSFVINTPYSIGFMGLAYTAGVDVCNVSDNAAIDLNAGNDTSFNSTTFVQPTVQTGNIIPSSTPGAYPIARNLWLLTTTLVSSSSTGLSLAMYDFIAFMMSSYGQQCVYQGGGVPLIPFPTHVAPMWSNSYCNQTGNPGSYPY
jgi:ABC-type phosphate transport system substrate-binding protein